jgi:hypothetical protein
MNEPFVPINMTTAQVDAYFKEAIARSENVVLDSWANYQRHQAAHASLIAERDRLIPASQKSETDR